MARITAHWQTLVLRALTPLLLAFCVLAIAPTQQASGAQGTIWTLAGSDRDRLFKEGSWATSVRFRAPEGVAMTGDGGFVVSDPDSNRIFGVTANGRVVSIAGTGRKGKWGEGVPATTARMSAPSGLAVTKFGEIIVADTGNHRIRKIDARGIITTIAGSTRGFSGDGNLAIFAQLRSPKSVSVREDGRILIADSGNDRIRQIDLKGVIHTVAGGGVLDQQEGGDARAALLLNPMGVSAAPNGRFLIADTDHNRIKVVDEQGRIWTAAGTGAPGFGGDNEPAAQSKLFGPTSIAATPNGGFVFTDSHNERVREVASGTVFTIAGGGTTFEDPDVDAGTKAIRRAAENVIEEGDMLAEDLETMVMDSAETPDFTVTDEEEEQLGEVLLNLGDFSGDGELATNARLNSPFGVAVGPDNSVLVTDKLNHRVRAILPKQPTATVSIFSGPPTLKPSLDQVKANYPATLNPTWQAGWHQLTRAVIPAAAA